MQFIGILLRLFASYLKSNDLEFKKKYAPGNFIKTGALPVPTRSIIQELYQKALQEERELHYAIYDQNALFADDHSEATTEPENDQDNATPQDEDEDNIAPEAQAEVNIEDGGAAAPPPEFQLSPEVFRRIRKRIRELVKSEDERTEKISSKLDGKVGSNVRRELRDDCEYAAQHARETDLITSKFRRI